MQRNILITLVLISFVFVAAGCQTTSTKKPQESPAPAGKEARYPGEVSTWLKNMKPYFVADFIEKGDSVYFIVNGGEKRTGGYKVDITRVREEANEVIAEVKFTEPEDSGATTQAITYPYDVYEWKGNLNDRPVHFLHTNGDQYIPRIIGCKPISPFQAGSQNIKVLTSTFSPSEVKVKGLARVFEAQINWAFVDDQGQILEEHYVTAESGGPDWGCYKINTNDIPENAKSIEIYWRSPKDGSRQDVINMNLNLDKVQGG
ncbi:Gmad2 immunoglobulin-like domain-containing protein [Syntrophomonas erecta]